MGLGGRLLNFFSRVIFLWSCLKLLSGVINGVECFRLDFWARLFAIVCSLNICENLTGKQHRTIKVFNLDIWPLDQFLWRLSIFLQGFYFLLSQFGCFYFSGKSSTVTHWQFWDLLKKIASVPHSCNTQKVEKDQRQSMLGICIIPKEKKELLINTVLEVKCPCLKCQCNHLHNINGLYKCQVCGGR